MQPMNRANETGQFWRQEHYRLHCAENWPDSPYKAAVLAAVHSALERLEATATEPFDPPACMVCATRRPPASVIIFPSRPKGSLDVWKPAAYGYGIDRCYCEPVPMLDQRRIQAQSMLRDGETDRAAWRCAAMQVQPPVSGSSA